MKNILIPGLDEQYKLLNKQIVIKNFSFLFIGSGLEEIAKHYQSQTDKTLEIIVEDYDSLLNSRLKLGKDDNINSRMMDFEKTDFNGESFDIIYAQASTTKTNRNKIVKEVKRLLKPNGFYCVGETVSLTKEVPRFVNDIWGRSDLLPLYIEDVKKYYEERKFKILAFSNLTYTLKKFYYEVENTLSESLNSFNDDELQLHKKLITKISHERNVYLKQGGDKHIGFVAMIMKKESN